jgi:hypothetical protein
LEEYSTVSALVEARVEDGNNTTVFGGSDEPARPLGKEHRCAREIDAHEGGSAVCLGRFSPGLP